MNKRIRILFTIPNFNTAGSGKVVYDLVNGLDKTKFDISIACGHDKGVFFKVVEDLGFPIYIYPTKTPYKPYHTLFFRIWKISRFYKKHDFDIVHSWQWSNDWTEALAAKFAGIKWIYTKKAMGFANKHWKIKSYLADFIVTINDEMRAYFPNKKAQALIPLGIDTNYYNPEFFKNQKQATDSKFHIITVANMVPVKGIEILIHAVHALKDKTIQLTILGDKDNDYGLAMERLCESLNMESQVVFHGKQLDVRPYIAKADLYVIPTLNQGRKEGMPMALVEAMSMGIPLLGSNMTGINFVLKDFKNLLFESGNSEDLQSKIQYMRSMDTQGRDEIGSTLRHYCMNHFSMTQFIKAHEELYITLLE